MFRATGPQGPVAIKVLAPAAELDAAARARFVREATALAALRHPALMTLLDHGVDDELGPYLVLPLLAGANLRVLVAGRPLGPEAAVMLAAPVAAALAAMHDAGFVHRDVKPENLIAGPDGQVTVVDLGLAWREGMTRHTESGAAVGTIGYMAPEQIEGHDVGAAADVWAVGVLLHEWIVGRRPFWRARPGEEAAATLVGHPPALPGLDRRVDEQLAGLVRACLAAGASARPTMRALAEALAAMSENRTPGGAAERAAVVADPAGYGARVAPAQAARLADEARAALRDGRPLEALAACDRGLAHAPDDAGLLALVDEIEATTAAAVVVAAPTTPGLPPRRRRWPWLAVTAVALSAVAIAAGILAQDPPPPAAPPPIAKIVSAPLDPEDRALAYDAIDLFGRAIAAAEPAGAAAGGPPPTTATGWLARARAQAPADSVASVRRALALAPTWPAAHRELCRVLVKLDDAGATAACDEALRLEPDDAAVLGLRAITLGRRGELDRAVADLTRVIAVDGDPAWRVARAWVHDRRGDVTAAAADRANACQLGLTEACARP